MWFHYLFSATALAASRNKLTAHFVIACVAFKAGGVSLATNDIFLAVKREGISQRKNCGCRGEYEGVQVAMDQCAAS